MSHWQTPTWRLCSLMSWNSCVERIQVARSKLEVAGDTRGRWDGPRLQQLLRNLVSTRSSTGQQTRRSVWCLPARRPTSASRSANSGPTIERSALDQIFDPLKRGPAQEDDTTPTTALGSDCISCAKLPWPMGAKSLCVPTGERPCSLCACLAAMRTYRHEQIFSVRSSNHEDARPQAISAESPWSRSVPSSFPAQAGHVF